MPRHLLLFLLPLAVTACSPGSDADIPEPDLNQKGDSFANVEALGNIAFNTTVSHRLTDEFQFVSYQFRAGEQARLTLSINDAGTDAALDTTLFLFRTPRGGTAEKIQSDNDSGTGDLSLLEDISLPGTDFYTVVIGTVSGGAGTFELGLTCLSDDCLPQIPTPVVGACVVEVESDTYYAEYRYDDLGRLLLVKEQDLVLEDEPVIAAEFDWTGGVSGASSVRFSDDTSDWVLSYQDGRKLREQEGTDFFEDGTTTVFRGEYNYAGDRLDFVDHFESDSDRFVSRKSFIYEGDKLTRTESDLGSDFTNTIAYDEFGGVSLFTSIDIVAHYTVDFENKPISIGTNETSRETFYTYSGPGCLAIALSWWSGQPDPYEPWQIDRLNL